MSVPQLLSRIPYFARAVQRHFFLQRILIQMEKVEARAKERIDRITKDKNDKLEELKKRAMQIVGPLAAFYETNRDKLLQSQSGTKARTDAGSYEWFPGANSIEVTDEEAAIAALAKGKHEDALRRKVELNKDYLLRHPEIVAKIPGIRIVQKQKRRVYFDDTKARVEKDVDTGQWTIVFPKEKK